jgi:hypothetical protein
VWDDALSWCNSQFFCRQILGWSLRHSHAVAVKRHSSMGTSFTHDEFFVSNPLNVKENAEYALDFALHLSHPFWSRWVWAFRLSAHCFVQGLNCTFSGICTESDAHSLSDPSRNFMRQDIQLQIKGHKIRKVSAHTSSCVKFCTLTPKICQYYYLPLHHLKLQTTSAIQKVSVPEIMVIPSYALMSLIWSKCWTELTKEVCCYTSLPISVLLPLMPTSTAAIHQDYKISMIQPWP